MDLSFFVLIGFLIAIVGLVGLALDDYEPLSFVSSWIVILVGIIIIIASVKLDSRINYKCEKEVLEAALEDHDVYFNGEEISSDAFSPEMILDNHYSYNISDDSLYIFSK